MRIVSWNVNGLRAVHKKGHWAHVWDLKPDILCLQETKASEDQLVEELKSIPGYTALFSSSKVKKGYSGVSIHAKPPIHEPIFGLGETRFDDEGRVVGAFFDDFVLLNVYFPNGGRGQDRIQYKLEFYDAFLAFIVRLRDDGHHVIFCGDVNTAHTEIDLARPKENQNNTGFLPEERAWIDKVIKAGFVDVYRAQHPDQRDVYTYWDLFTGARDRNVGWRIDYFFVSENTLPHVIASRIHNEVYGSDHCPISLELDF